MCRKTSKRQSGRPASSTSTRVPGSSESRFASTQPADPPPTITTSNRSSIERRSYQRGARRRALLRGGNDADGQAMAAGAGVVGGEAVGELARAAVEVVEA